jgi:hypothetical protein
MFILTKQGVLVNSNELAQAKIQGDFVNRVIDILFAKATESLLTVSACFSNTVLLRPVGLVKVVQI